MSPSTSGLILGKHSACVGRNMFRGRTAVVYSTPQKQRCARAFGLGRIYFVFKMCLRRRNTTPRNIYFSTGSKTPAFQGTSFSSLWMPRGSKKGHGSADSGFYPRLFACARLAHLESEKTPTTSMQGMRSAKVKVFRGILCYRGDAECTESSAESASQGM